MEMSRMDDPKGKARNNDNQPAPETTAKRIDGNEEQPAPRVAQTAPAAAPNLPPPISKANDSQLEDSKRLSEQWLELKLRYSYLEECNRLRLAISERRRYLSRCSPNADEINKCNEAEIKLCFHTQRIAGEIMKHEEIVKRLGFSSEELSRLRWNHHLEDWKDAQKTPVTDLPLADFWRRVQSFLDTLDAQCRPPNSMAPPMEAASVPRSQRKGRPKDKLTQKRREIIAEIAATGKTGEYYIQAINARGLETPIKWQKNEKCPKVYPDAYNHADPKEREKWRARIWDEKNKVVKVTRHNSP